VVKWWVSLASMMHEEWGYRGMCLGAYASLLCPKLDVCLAGRGKAYM